MSDLRKEEVPDKYCITTPDGDCISTDPRCMHQPTLRLADRLDLWGDQGDLLEAAAELRRLHALNAELVKVLVEIELLDDSVIGLNRIEYARNISRAALTKINKGN